MEKKKRETGRSGKSSGVRQTRFTDVCGSMDELKRLLAEEYEKTRPDPAGALAPLVEDAVAMVERMEERIREYEKAAAAILRLYASSGGGAPGRSGFDKAVSALKERFSGGPLSGADVPEIGEKAEQIRDFAARLEHDLRVRKDLSIKAYELLEELRGGRPWLLPEESRGSETARYESEYRAWLPPEPHRSELLKWLAVSRAEVEKTGPGQEPLVVFEDGGAILMSRARYDKDIRNFHPRGFSPGATGRKYRKG